MQVEKVAKRLKDLKELNLCGCSRLTDVDINAVCEVQHTDLYYSWDKCRHFFKALQYYHFKFQHCTNLETLIVSDTAGKEISV